jgi:hypothetical protein
MSPTKDPVTSTPSKIPGITNCKKNKTNTTLAKKIQILKKLSHQNMYANIMTTACAHTYIYYLAYLSG